jgi:hypothetical protein
MISSSTSSILLSQFSLICGPTNIIINLATSIYILIENLIQFHKPLSKCLLIFNWLAMFKVYLLLALLEGCIV